MSIPVGEPEPLSKKATTAIATMTLSNVGVNTAGVYTTSETDSFAVGDLVTIASCQESGNDGNFRIGALSNDVSITVVNASTGAGITTIADATSCTIERSATVLTTAADNTAKTVTITRSNGGVISPSTIDDLQIANVKNPEISGGTGTFSIKTTTRYKRTSNTREQELKNPSWVGPGG